MGSTRTTIHVPEEMIDEIDDRRPSTVSRSEWIRGAIQGRLDDEDAGEWTDPNSDDADDAAEVEA